MRVVDPLLSEMEQEAKTTRRVLECVPEAKLGWKPHDKSMSLGQLALHIAGTPAFVVEALGKESMDLPAEAAGPDLPAPESVAQILSTHDQSHAALIKLVSGMDDLAAGSMWRLTKGGKELMALPKAGFLRMVGMNHQYHHRGQLSVYLRMLDVKLPSIYGPSADTNPFA